MVILVGILTALIFAVSQTFRTSPPYEATTQKKREPIDIIEDVVVGLFLCLGVAIFVAMGIRLWINEF